MSDTRKFSIYRYNSENKPKVLGSKPFLVAGPNLMKMKNSLERIIRKFFGEGTMEDREVVAEFLLEDRIVSALWSTAMPSCEPLEKRHEIEIQELIKEIGPVPWKTTTVDNKDLYWDLGRATWEYLDGIPTAAMKRSYVSEDGIKLE